MQLQVSSFDLCQIYPEKGGRKREKMKCNEVIMKVKMSFRNPI